MGCFAGQHAGLAGLQKVLLHCFAAPLSATGSPYARIRSGRCALSVDSIRENQEEEEEEGVELRPADIGGSGRLRVSDSAGVNVLQSHRKGREAR